MLFITEVASWFFNTLLLYLFLYIFEEREWYIFEMLSDGRSSGIVYGIKIWKFLYEVDEIFNFLHCTYKLGENFEEKISIIITCLIKIIL